MGKRYQAMPFSQVGHKTLYAVWDNVARNRRGDFIIEPNGLVWVSDKKAVRIWAKYLNDNLPYENLLCDKPFSPSIRWGSDSPH